ncbi:sugar-binding transcriptional regulator [Salinifilum ghardaiensis]
MSNEWDTDTALLAATAAHRHFVLGESKIDIAADLGLSRFKVARLITAAQQRGLVRVEFDLPLPVDPGLGDAIARTYGLRRALVLDRAHTPDARPVLRERIGALAAALLGDLLSADDVLGLAWARTVNAMAAAVGELPPCPVVQLCGVHAGMDMRDRTVETVRHVAASSGGPPYPIYGPLVLPDRRTTDVLRSQPGIAETFEQFRRITTAVVSIGAWQHGESTVYDTIGESERDGLARAGAVAEIAGRVFDGTGAPVATELAHRILAIGGDQLRGIGEVVGLGYGTAKAPAIAAILRSGIITSLIIDTDAAERLLPEVS